MIYNLRDIHDFLLQKGYPEWNYEIYDKHLRNKKLAKTEDFTDKFGFFENVLLTFVNKHNFTIYLEVYITDFKFITFKSESNIMGSGLTTYTDNDFTHDWIDFLLSAHKEEYANSLIEYAKKNQLRIKQKAEEKIKKVIFETRTEIQDECIYFKDLENKAKKHRIATIKNEKN